MFKIHDHLCELDEQNKTNFKTIEQALLVYALDDDNAENLTGVNNFFFFFCISNAIND